MSVDKTRDKYPNAQCDVLRRAQEFGLRAYLYFRERHERSYAREMTGKALGVTTRKARSILEQEPIPFGVEEYRRARTAYINHLIEKERDLIRRTEAARRERLELQKEEDSECGPYCLPLFVGVGNWQLSAVHHNGHLTGGSSGTIASSHAC